MNRIAWRLSMAACVCATAIAAHATDELVVRLAPGWATPEHAAYLVHGWGKVLWKEGDASYRIQIRNGLDAKMALARVAGRTGVEAVRRSWRPGVAALTNNLDDLQAMIEDLKAQARDKHLDPEEAGVDYFEAYQDYVWQRAYPARTIDWSLYGAAIAQRERMPQLQPGPTDSSIGWEFMGPTNLDIPYRTYYGTRPINGRVNGLAWDPVDPSTYYLAAAGGGVWKTTDAGGTWVPLSDDWPTIHANAVAVDPSNRNTVYAGTGDFHGGVGYSLGLMKSPDGGSTWSLKGAAEFGNKAISSIAIDPETPSRILVTTGRGASGGNGNVWRSNDGGETWSTAMGTSAVWWEVCFGAKDTGTGTRWLYAVGGGTGGNVWRSGDRGSTWTQLLPPISAGNHSRLEIAASPISPNTVYLLVPADRTIWKSIDAGVTWSNISAGFVNGTGSNPTYNWSQSTYDAFIACSSKNGVDDVVYVGLIDVVQSTDGGATWRSIGGPTYVSAAIVHNDHQSVAVSPMDPNQVLFGSDGGVYRMTYNPATNDFSWAMLSKNLGVSQFYKSSHHPTNANVAIGGTQDNASPVSTGDLLNWRNEGGGDGGFAAINQSNPNIQYVTSQYLGLYRTTNGWNTSSTISPGTGSDSKLFIAPIHLNQANPNYLYAGTNYLWRWSETSLSWTARLGGQLLASSGSVRSIATSPASASRIYTGATNGDVYMTENGGNTWTQIDTGVTSLPNRQITYIDVHPANPDDILVTVSGSGAGHLWRCTNPRAGAARTWVDVSGTGSTALPNVQANTVARDLDQPSTTWFVGSDVGVFVTVDGGQNWANMTGPLGLPNVQVNDLHTVPGTRRLNAATYGRGMWRLTLPNDDAPLLALGVSPDSVLGGQATTGTVTLDGGAALSGSSVALSSASPLASTPASVVVPFGQSSADFAVTTLPVGVVTPVEIRGSRLGVQKTAILTLQPAPGVLVPDWFLVSPGVLVSGGLSELANPDDQRLVARFNLAAEEVGFPVTLTLRATSPTQAPSSLRFVLEGYSELAGVQQSIQLFDWTQGAYITLDARIIPTSETTVAVQATGALARFVQAGTGRVAARIGWKPAASEVAFPWRVRVDRAWWIID